MTVDCENSEIYVSQICMYTVQCSVWNHGYMIMCWSQGQSSFLVKIKGQGLFFTLTMLADRSTVSIGVTPLWINFKHKHCTKA